MSSFIVMDLELRVILYTNRQKYSSEIFHCSEVVRKIIWSSNAHHNFVNLSRGNVLCAPFVCIACWTKSNYIVTYINKISV